MGIQENIQNLTEFEIEKRDAYLDRLIDFLKWTSTIALAGSLWMGTNINKYVIDSQSSSIPQDLDFLNAVNIASLLFSFIFIIISLVISVVIFYSILEMWKNEWEYIGVMNPFYSILGANQDKIGYSDNVFSKRIQEIKTKHYNFYDIKKVRTLFQVHVYVLIMGIFLFIISILLQ